MTSIAHDINVRALLAWLEEAKTNSLDEGKESSKTTDDASMGLIYALDEAGGLPSKVS